MPTMAVLGVHVLVVPIAVLMTVSSIRGVEGITLSGIEYRRCANPACEVPVRWLRALRDCA